MCARLEIKHTHVPYGNCSKIETEYKYIWNLCHVQTCGIYYGLVIILLLLLVMWDADTNLLPFNFSIETG